MRLNSLVRRSTTVSSIRTTNEDNKEWGKVMRKECTRVVAHQTRTITKWPLNYKKAMADEVQDANRSTRLKRNSRNPLCNM